MNYILFDGASRNSLLPFTYTRPVADIRIGILTIREKWERHIGSTTSTVTEDYLSDKFPMVELEENVMINASYLPTGNLVRMVKNLQSSQAIFHKDEPVAFYVKEGQEVHFDSYDVIQYDYDIFTVKYTWDIFSKNERAIKEDFELITKDRKSQPIPASANVINPQNIFIEEGAVIEFATLNASKGPIYIGKGAEIMEGTFIRGPLALGDQAVVKMGTRIYGGTTIGPKCKAGGEINNSVFFGNSNKGHDGYMGNTVIGEWCNLGADTN
ncbi:glucose-1-phosphate thymidylyltransferase, partial [Flavobacteriaceae bacterium (ex Bugula neritina AB1)]